MAAYRQDGERWRRYSLLSLEMSDGTLGNTREYTAKSAGQNSILTLQGETLTFQVGYRYWVSKTFVEVGRIDVLGGEGGIKTELKGFE